MRTVVDQSTHAIALTKASIADIPTLVRVYLAAFANDNAVRLMFKNEDHYREELQSMLHSEMSNPNGSFIKAISKETGDILGWLGFGFVGYPELEGQGAVPAFGHAVPTLKGSEHNLRSAIEKDFTRMRNEWMFNKQYIHIGILVTDPAHQRRGVGSALIRYATSKADSDSVACWIESSPAGHNVYYHAGFRDVGSLELDLREYAPGGKYGKQGWGLFEIVYMLRLPDRKKN